MLSVIQLSTVRYIYHSPVSFLLIGELCPKYLLGSGITIYGVLFPGVTSFIVSLDGEMSPAPAQNTPTPPSAPAIYNVTLYSLQSLSQSSHTLTISIVSWDDGPAWGTFDYAYVTEMSQSPTSSSISSPSLSPSSSPSPSALGFSVSSSHSQ